MRRKKIRATKKNKEIIRNYKKVKSILDFCDDVNIKTTCSKCKRKYVIRTHHPELFTEEVKENFVCLLCEYKREKRK